MNRYQDQYQELQADWADEPVAALSAVMPRHPTVCMAVRTVALAPERDAEHITAQAGLDCCTQCRSPQLHRCGGSGTYLVLTCTNCNYSHVRLSP